MLLRRSAQNKESLADVKLRSPDLVLDTGAKVDLEGVTVRLLWYGGAHKKGDELILVEPDGTLVSGDVAQNKVVPNISGNGGMPSSWIAVLDKISALHVQHVLPTHSASGDGSLVSRERAFIDDLRTHALALKQQGVSADDAGKQADDQMLNRWWSAARLRILKWERLKVGGLRSPCQGTESCTAFRFEKGEEEDDAARRMDFQR